MAYCKRCQCGHVMVFEDMGGAPLRCPKCHRFTAFLKEEKYQDVKPEEEKTSGEPPKSEEKSVAEQAENPKPQPEKIPQRFLITLETPDGEFVIPINEKVTIGRNSVGKEYLGRFPDVTREHITLTPRTNGITATLTDHGRWGTFVNGTRMVKESSVVVSNYSEIRLASKAIFVVRVKEVDQNA